jgi:hypothetical protein
MTSNVRKSVLTEVEQDPKHSIDEALRPLVTLENGGLSVKDMPVKLVSVVDPNASSAKRKTPELRAILQPIGTRYTHDPLWPHTCCHAGCAPSTGTDH